MGRARGLLTGMGLGAGLMWLFEPAAGRRRRGRIRDRAAHMARTVDRFMDAAARDLDNRVDGLVAEIRARFRNEPVSDAVLVERVRAKMGRAVSHPGSIEVTARGGHVTVSGPILAHEADALAVAIAGVRGVASVENRLSIRREASDEPGLQGHSVRAGERAEFLQANWSPGPRLAAMVAGGAMLAYGARRGGLTGSLYGTAGLGLLVRGATNTQLPRVLGTGGGRRAVDLQKTINIDAPIEDVFNFWLHWENFPRFMSRVREVRDLGNGFSHWVVEGPAGSTVEWDAVVKRAMQNEEISWETVPAQPVEHAGTVQFRPNHDGSTQVHVRLSYRPPAGALGHVAARLLGADPVSDMDADLARMKTYLETGHPPHDAAEREAAA